MVRVDDLQIARTKGTDKYPADVESIPDRVLYAIYAVSLVGSISFWFTAIHAPLWLDETHSFFVIKAGFRQIMPRMGWPTVPVYPYILWLSTKVLGTSEVALRIPSILAMLGAVYLLYRAARELFDHDVAIIAAIVFCLHPVVIFAAIDVRPYAFAALAINASILALVQLRHNDSNWMAALFGLLAASIAHFQFLFTVILPAFAICFFAIKTDDRKTLWRQACIAFAAFVLAFLPVVSVLKVMFQTRGTHVFARYPTLAPLVLTFTIGTLVLVLALTLLIALVKRRLDVRSHFKDGQGVLCVSLGVVPILILFGISRATSIQVFVPRYLLVAVPGIALCWVLMVNWINSRALRLLFAVALVVTAACLYLSDPASKLHSYTWKYALEMAERNASADGATVLICSDFPEANDVPMPTGEAVKDSGLFAPLSYYKLSVPVVGLPRALNDEAIRVASRFLQEATQRHERFLALAFVPSYKTLDWIESRTSATYSVHEIGISNGIKVLEFRPRA